MVEVLIEKWGGDLASGSMMVLKTPGLTLDRRPMGCLPIQTGSLVRSIIGATTVGRTMSLLETTTCLALLLSVARQTIKIIILFLPQPILCLPERMNGNQAREYLVEMDIIYLAGRILNIRLHRVLLECRTTPRHN